MTKNISHRILIIEDNFDSAESLKLLLEIHNHTVETAHDGESGLAAAAKFAPQIIVCDIGLPGKINGLEVAENLRGDEKFQSLYLIALSGYGQIEDVEEAQNAGFHDYLVKPVDFDKLIKLIEKFGDSEKDY